MLHNCDFGIPPLYPTQKISERACSVPIDVKIIKEARDFFYRISAVNSMPGCCCGFTLLLYTSGRAANEQLPNSVKGQGLGRFHAHLMRIRKKLNFPPTFTTHFRLLEAKKNMRMLGYRTTCTCHDRRNLNVIFQW